MTVGLMTRLILLAVPLQIAALKIKDSRAETKNALVMVCFHAGGVGQHSAHHSSDGCLWNMASFLYNNPNDDVILISPKSEWVDPKIQKIAEKDSRVKIALVGQAPWDFNGQKVGAGSNYPGNSIRQVWASKVLQEHANEYENVMIVDGSDIVFQKDPFELMRKQPAADLFFFGDRGDDHKRGGVYFHIRTKSLGGKYNEGAFLQEIHQAFYNKDAGYSVYANGGAVLGKAQAVLDCQNEMAKIAIETGYIHSDQAQMNIARFYHMKQHGAESVVAFPDWWESVTMKHKHWKQFDKEGLLIRADGTPLTFLHQYDGSAGDKAMVQRFLIKRIQPWLDEMEVQLR